MYYWQLLKKETMATCYYLATVANENHKIKVFSTITFNSQILHPIINDKTSVMLLNMSFQNSHLYLNSRLKQLHLFIAEVREGIDVEILDFYKNKFNSQPATLTPYGITISKQTIFPKESPIKQIPIATWNPSHKEIMPTYFLNFTVDEARIA